MTTVEERLSALEETALRTERQLRLWKGAAVFCMILAAGSLLPRPGETAVDPLAKAPKPTQVKAPFQVISSISHRVLLQVAEDGTGAQVYVGSAFGHPTLLLGSTNQGSMMQMFSLDGSPNLTITDGSVVVQGLNLPGTPGISISESGLTLTNGRGVVSTSIGDSVVATNDPITGGTAAALSGARFPGDLGPVGRVGGQNVNVVNKSWFFPSP